jgi:kynurenine formamidase
MPGRLIDVSHAVGDGTVTYPGLPAPEVSDHLTREQAEQTYAPGVTFQIGRICMVANTGTYVDAPFHRFADGIDLAELELKDLAGRPGLVIDPLPNGPAIGPESLGDIEIAGHAVLFRTGWDRHWETPHYAEDHPYLIEATAIALVEAGAAIVGIDSLNIDDTEGGERPVHSALLRAGIPIVEHLTCLDALPGSGFRFFAVPVKVRGMGTFPVRAFARID